MIAYDDDSTYYDIASNDHGTIDLVGPAIRHVVQWSSDSSIIQNTEYLNTSLSNLKGSHNTLRTPACDTRFLGFVINNKLNCREHVKSYLSKCYSRFQGWIIG